MKGFRQTDEIHQTKCAAPTTSVLSAYIRFRATQLITALICVLQNFNGTQIDAELVRLIINV